MEVILKQIVPKLGKKDQIVKVARGYARNFLFPQGLAIVATKPQKQALNIRIARSQLKLAEEKVKSEVIREKLNDQVIRIEGNVGKDSTKLFGAITSQDIVDLIEKELGVTIEKRQVGLVQPIKRTGINKIQIDLHHEVDAFITLDVFNPHAPVEEVAEVSEETAVAEEVVEA